MAYKVENFGKMLTSLAVCLLVCLLAGGMELIPTTMKVLRTSSGVKNLTQEKAPSKYSGLENFRIDNARPAHPWRLGTDITHRHNITLTYELVLNHPGLSSVLPPS
jgi:hypothetical protein